MAGLTADYVAWLRLRRAKIITVAQALADRAAARGHGFTPRERRDYDELDTALTNVDNRLRVAWIEHRFRPGGHTGAPGEVWDWAGDNGGDSYSAAPGSGGRATLDRLRRR